MKYTIGEAFMWFRDDNHTPPEVVIVDSLRSRGSAKLSNGWVVDEDGVSEGTGRVKGGYIRAVAGSFEYWFADCVLIALDGGLTPDKYVWDLKNSDDWKDKFNLGMSSTDAVDATFKAH